MVKPGAPSDHLVKALDFAGTARMLLEAGRWARSVSAAYYAVFHTAQALLGSIGKSAETHAGVLSLLAQHFVKDGPLPSGSSRLISHLQTDRLLADYGVRREIGREDALDNAVEARDLIIGMLSVLDSSVPDAGSAIAELRVEANLLAEASRRLTPPPAAP